MLELAIDTEELPELTIELTDEVSDEKDPELVVIDVSDNPLDDGTGISELSVDEDSRISESVLELFVSLEVLNMSVIDSLSLVSDELVAASLELGTSDESTRLDIELELRD